MNSFTFPKPRDSDELRALRLDVRQFVAEQLRDQPLTKRSYTYLGVHDPAFSEALAARGWVGMSISKEYGGRDAGVLERYVVFEELIAARAPMAAHSVAERQSGPLIQRIGTEYQKRLILPRIVAGRCVFCIGMSEPGSGSDLASVRTRARRATGGWLINGNKIWTSSAHRSDYMILFCRTSDAGASRHAGLSQFLVDMRTPGITCKPFTNMADETEFNEVYFEDVFVPDEMLLGEEGEGWKQVTSELALERSGPERFLSGLGLLEELVGALGRRPNERGIIATGRMLAHIHVLRRMSRSVATLLEQGEEPSVEAALIKDIGTVFEQQAADIARLVLDTEPDFESDDSYTASLAQTLVRAPSCTIRGGTTEVLRGMIARGIGLR